MDNNGWIRGGFALVMLVLRKASVAKCFGILAFTVLMLVIGCSSDLESQVEIIKEVPVDMLIDNKIFFFFSHTIKKQPYNKVLLHQHFINR